MSNIKVAIFVITYNRLHTLRRSLEAYNKLSTPHEIIIIDNGTNDPAALAYLQTLPYKIYTLPKITIFDNLKTNIVSGIVRYYEHNYAPFYAVSDCDICFDDAGHNTLDIYIGLYEGLGGKYNIGPALRIDCIPNHYPLKNKAIIDSAFDFLPHRQKTYNGVKYNEVGIDTTFCMFPAGTAFGPLSSTVRVNIPYAAHHLDWYIDIKDPTPDQLVYMFKDCAIGSSGGSFISGMYEDLQISPEYAFQKRISQWEHKELFSYCIDPYHIAWMLQFGIGCQQDIAVSEWMIKMIRSYGIHKVDKYQIQYIFRMIYENNFQCLRI